jgi:DNA-binding Lrp family transcriptional regulator
MLSKLEIQVIKAVQEDIPVIPRPFEAMAKSLEISEERFLEILRDLCNRGVIRRLGATLKHQNSGFKANAMVAWQVAENRVEAVGAIMAGFREVSHCYRRNPASNWPFNLYTMVHAKSEEACLEIARKISEKTGVLDYKLLFSRRELKKTSMKYFATNGR